MTDRLHLNKMDAYPTNRPPVLRLALLQHILLIHELGESYILFVQQSLQVGGRVQVKLPKHGGWHLSLAAHQDKNTVVS